MNGYLQDTLHGVLNCRCKGNCLLKSMHIDNIEGGTAYITVEPYDDAFDQSHVEETIGKVRRTLWRRRKAIWDAMGSIDCLNVTIYDEWTMKDSLVFWKDANNIYSAVN